MKTRLAITIAVLALGACEKKEENRSTSVEKTVSSIPTAVPSSVATLPKALQPLLKTDRVMVTISGNMSWRDATIATEIDAVLADIRTLPPSTARDKALATALGLYAKTDPRRAADLLVAWHDAKITSWLDAAEKILTELAKIDREAAADFIVTQVPVTAQVSVWSEILWRFPPAEQVSYLDRIPQSSAKKQIVNDLLHAWTDADPAASAAWLDTFIRGLSERDLKDLETRRRYINGFKVDPKPWLTAAHEASTPEARKFFAEVGWKNTQGKAAPELVTQFAEFLPDVAAREQSRQIDENPAGFATGLSPETVASMPTATRKQLIERWAGSHPADALDWAVKHELPEAALALRPLYSQDPAAAVSLAKTVPKGDALNNALSSLTHMVAMDGNPSAARDLLPLISNAESRSIAEKNIESAGKAR
ncbi:MAG TPA: hypothetical protein VGE67_16220 [Haloferula sp.]